MELKLPLPESLVKKLKAFNALNSSSVDVETFIIGLIDRGITDAIQEALGGEPVQPSVNGHAMRMKSAVQEDHSGVTDGLGDDEDEVEEVPDSITGSLDGDQVEDMDEMVPKQGGLTDEVLENDLAVEDPNQEAVVDSSSFADDLGVKSADEVFMEMAGLGDEGTLAEKRTISGRRQRREPRKTKGIVTPMTGEAQATF